MKKRFALILALIMVCIAAFAILAACKDPNSGNGGGGGDVEVHNYVDGVCTVCNKSIASSASQGSTTWDAEHTIKFVSTQGQNLQAVMDLAIAAFEEKYPGWNIDPTYLSGDYDVLRDTIYDELQTDDYPDVALCYPDHIAYYMQSQKVVDLSKYIYSKDTILVTNPDLEEGAEQKAVTVGYSAEEIADFASGFWAEGHAENFSGYSGYGYTDDTIFTLPFAKSTELLFYNKTILDQEGIAVPETWDDLWKACAKLSAKYPTCTPLGYDSESNWFITMCAQNGWGYTTAAGGNADHYLFNNPDVVEWLQDMQDNYNNAYFVTRALYSDQYTSNLFKKGTDGGAFFCIGSSAGASNQSPSNNAFAVGVAHIPGSKVIDDRGRESINKSVISQGPSIFQLRSNASNADEKEYMTFLFIKECLEPMFQSQYSLASGYVPVRNSTYTLENYAPAIEAGKAGTGSVVQRAIYISSLMSDDFFTSPAFIGSSRARETVGNLFVSVMRGVSSIEEEVKAAVKKCGGNA